MSNKLNKKIKQIDSELYEEYNLEEDIGYLLGRAYTEAYRKLIKRFSELNITPQQHLIIVKLLQRGELSQNLLGRLVGMNPATVHGIISRLRARRLLRMRPHPDDQRLVLVSLSDAGRAMAARLSERAIENHRHAFSALGDEEQKLLKSLLKRLFDQEPS